MESNDRRTRHQREIEILESFPPARRWDGDYERGVLLSDSIEDCVARYGLIDPFDPSKLKPAAYELSVGEEFTINGETKRLDPARTESIVIPPFGVVIVQTLERLNMPNFLIARWNIRVHWAYHGLLWVGGAQVDPGFCGFLFCPLYNLSDQVVTLGYGEPIAQIDFVTTTTPIPRVSKQYPRPAERHRLLIEDYNPQLKSALVKLATDRLDSVEKDVETVKSETRTNLKRNEDRIDSATAITFGTLAILFAAIVLLFERNQGQVPALDPYLFWTSLVAVLCSVWAFLLVLNLFWTEPPALAMRFAGAKKWLTTIAAIAIALALVVFPYAVWQIESNSVRGDLSRAQADASSAAAQVQLLKCQVKALAAKRNISSCR